MKKRLLIFLFCFLFMFSFNLLAAVDTENVQLGTLSKGKIHLIYEDAVLDTYKAYDGYYVAIADLKRIGCSVSLNAAEKFMIISKPVENPVPKEGSDLSIDSKSFSLYSGTVKVGNLQSQAIISENRVLIPLGALRQFCTFSISENDYYIYYKDEIPISADETQIVNISTTPLQATVTDIYWNNGYIQKDSTYNVPAEGFVARQLTEDNEALYISTVVKSYSGEDINYTTTSTYGQINEPLLKKYSAIKDRKFLDSYGDDIDVDAILKAEETVNSKGLSSSTKYLVWTDISTQSTYIFEGSKNNWSLLRYFICSTGKNSSPTPTGTYKLTQKVPSFGQAKGYCCKYAFGFIGTTYLYHSIIFDKTGTYLLENKGVLGTKASDGCVRFSEANAKWFYDNMISGTTVWIS